MRQHPSNSHWKILVLLFATVPWQVSILKAQVQTTEVAVTGEPESYAVNGTIYPQFWKATLPDQSMFVPLDNIISFGIQDYEITGGGHVHELSIALKSQIMMRVYVVEAPKMYQEIDAQTQGLQKKVEARTGEVSPVSNIQSESVVKHYPATTHLSIMEFRIKKRSDVKALYESLESAYIDFTMREVQKQDRDSAVRSTSVK